MICWLGGPSPICASMCRNTTPTNAETVKFHFISLYPIVFFFLLFQLGPLHCHGELKSGSGLAKSQPDNTIEALQHFPSSAGPSFWNVCLPKAKQTKAIPLIVQRLLWEACYIRVTGCVHVTICYIYKRVHAWECLWPHSGMCKLARNK